jgi:hypothetical protein
MTGCAEEKWNEYQQQNLMQNERFAILVASTHENQCLGGYSKAQK